MTRASVLSLGVLLCGDAACSRHHVDIDTRRPQKLKVMAYNVLFEKADDAATLAAIADEQPDIVCLTEVTARGTAASDRKKWPQC